MYIKIISDCKCFSYTIINIVSVMSDIISVIIYVYQNYIRTLKKNI